MNLNELKKMIAEEYANYTAEQQAGMGGAQMVPPPMDGPGIAVSDDDIDVMGGEDSEATLRQIYDMLKAYFEGGDTDIMPPADGDMGDDMGDDKPKAPKPKAQKSDKKDDKADYDKDDDKDDEDDKKDLKERFKKLANIIKG